ncbi:MFS-type transporter SLC18B1-like isoform X2 [Limulus polyphemus]|uniref:MFS-type transporter SLC18B1-like isoform X2 n=1 Tax=Limulus polyphemus TaxID=6850 RepID=A0ABM1B4M8_LIMPO|nr:MFS-type transporter SLC18B1-like isoform X2 [Limulus polyphemus]
MDISLFKGSEAITAARHEEGWSVPCYKSLLTREDISKNRAKTMAPENSFGASNKSKDVKNATNKITIRQWQILLLLSVSNLVIAACISLQAPFFPREAEEKGASPTIYGFVFGVYELGVFISSPIYGKIISWITPKFLVNAGLFVAGTTTILFGFLDHSPPGTPFIVLAILVRLVEGFGAAAFVTASYTYAAAEFPGRVASAFATIETFFGLGLLLGPTIGGALYQAGGYPLPFVVLGATQLFVEVCSIFILPRPDRNEKPKSGNMFKFLADTGVLLDGLLITTTLVFLGYNSATLEPHLRQFDLQPVVLGTIFMITATIYVITTPVWGWLCDRGFDPKLLAVIGGVMCIVSLILIGPAPFLPFTAELWMVSISLVLCGIGLAAKFVCAFISALNDALKRGFPDDMSTHGLVSALCTICMSIGAFIGPTIGGYLLEHLGYRQSTFILLIMEVSLMILLTLYMIWRKVKLLKENPEKRSPANSSEATPLLSNSKCTTFTQTPELYTCF